MARTFPGEANSYWLSNANAGSDLAFNTDCQVLGLVYYTGTGTPSYSNVVFAVGEAARGIGLSVHDISGAGNTTLKCWPIGNGERTPSPATPIPLNVWTAVTVHISSGSTPVTFRTLRFDTGVISTGTSTSTPTIVAPLSTDDVAIGNLMAPYTSIVYSFAGDIYSVAYCQSTLLSDDEFRAWAYTQQRPRGVVASWTLWGRGEEQDETGNGLALEVVGGTLPVADNPPVRPRFGWDEERHGAELITLPSVLTTRNVALGDARRNI